jgi:hypothetical protein
MISRSENRQVILSLFAELIGVLGGLRFASVSDKFLTELEKVPGDTDARENRKTEMVIRSMRFLKLKVPYLTCWSICLYSPADPPPSLSPDLPGVRPGRDLRFSPVLGQVL